MIHDLRELLRVAAGCSATPTAVVMDAQAMRSTPESGHRAGYNGHKKRKGSKLHAVVDTLGHLLTLSITPASEQERSQVEELSGGDPGDNG